MEDLRGKVAIVTGGASGLGAAICRMMTGEGMNVLCGDVNEAGAEELAEELLDAAGSITPVGLDVTKEADAERICGLARERFGGLDVLVNNAGVDHTLSVGEMSVHQFDHVVTVNLRGPFVMSKHALPVMRPKAAIVNVTSTAAKRTWANASAYHASKWGLLGFSHALHVEARAHGVKVTGLVVGGMRTPFILDRFPEVDPTTLQDPANVARAVRFILTQPEETVIPEMMVIPMRETSWP
ncbi:MAG: SDR family oxidoreductase [Actinobacteria bacterium]|nr:MAG: SDR family oxidoreductase [Actinomycetota bacterium]